EPRRPAPAGEQRGPRADADEGPARPGPLLGGLEDERPGTSAGELAVQAHGRDVVGEEPAHDGDDPAVVGGELAERREVRRGRAPLAHAGSPTTAPRSPPASKQLRVPVWHAGPTCSTRTRSASPSQSRATERTCWTWPEVSPLRQYSCRESDQ